MPSLMSLKSKKKKKKIVCEWDDESTYSTNIKQGEVRDKKKKSLHDQCQKFSLHVTLF